MLVVLRLGSASANIQVIIHTVVSRWLGTPVDRRTQEASLAVNGAEYDGIPIRTTSNAIVLSNLDASVTTS